MPLYLPSWLPAPVVECVAGHFPVGNEDAMRRCGDYLSDQADWFRKQAEHYDNKATLRHIIRGQTGDSAEEGYRRTAEYFRAQADDTDTLAEEQYEGANSLELQKWTVIGFAVILTWTLAHAAITFTFGGALEAYIATMRTKTAVRWAWAKMLQYISGQSMRLAAERGALRLAGKMAAIGAIQGGGINAAVQLNQVADGHRDEMDRKAAGIAGGAGGVGGGVGMLFGRWFGNRWAIPATTALAGRSARTGVRLLVQVSGTAVVGAGGGIAGGLAGAAVALKLSGEDLTLGNFSEGLLPAITGGFVGAAAHGAAGIRAAAADASTPPAGRGQMQLEELIALAGPEATGDRSAPPSAAVNKSDWNPVGLRNALPDNVNSAEVVDFRSGSAAADPAAANPIAPKSPEPHATPLRDILAARHNSENWSGPKQAGSETASGTTPAPKHPADGAAVTAHPAPGESPKSPSSVPPERATVTAPNTPHPADGAPNRARPAAEGDNTHTRPEVSTATPHPADSESGSGAGQARGHAETSGDRTQDGPAASPKAAERADQATETKGGGHSTDSDADADAGSGAVRTRADGDTGEAPAAAKDVSEQPIPADSEAAQPAARAPRVVDSEHTKAGQPDGSAPKASDDSPAPTMTAVAEPEAPAVKLEEHGRNSGDRPAAAARQRPAGKAVTGEERPPAGSDSRAAPGDRPPRVSAPKPAAGERPPAVDPHEASRGRGQDDAPSREPEPEHGRAIDDGPEQQANDHPDATGTRDKPESEATGKEPEPEHTRSDEEGVRTQADDDPEATGTRGEPEPEHARADDDGDQHRGDEQPDAGEDSAKALARAYRAQADDILMEYESRDWSTVSDQELKAMLFSGNDREAALAVIEVINRGEGKVLRWTQVMGMLAVRDGHVGRMQAGEGKTLVFQAASALRAARGEPVRVLTTMDTLALEAYDIGQKLFGNYGFDIRLMNPDNPYAPVAEGQATISFGTLHADGFGELRGNVAPGRIKQVDEVDAAVKGSVFILSEGAGNAASPEVTARVEDVHGFLRDAVKAGLLSRADFVRAAGASEDHTTLTGSDRAKVEHILGGELTAKLEKIIGRIPSESEAHRIAMAATAEWRYTENDDYVVWHHPELGPEFRTDSDGNVLVVDGKKVLNPDSHKVYIIDQTTHKVMFDAETSTESRWNGGLAQAVEAKHGIRIRADPTSTKTVTVRELFSSELCDEFSGLSATTDNADAELRQIGTGGADNSTREIIDIPRLKPSQLEGADPANDIRVGTQGEKHEAMAAGVAEMHATGRPIEVICDRNSEVASVSAKLTARGIEHVAVDAKWFLEHGVTAEADLLAIFKEAGKEGMVLVINRQGARGVDIPISPEINERGGLHVLKSSRSAEHRDIDIQAENRTARSGGKGSVQYYVALDDPLFAKSPRAQISVIRYIAAETQHESALAQHQAAVAEHRAAPTTESRQKLDAAGNNLENSRKSLAAAEADVRGLVSKLQPAGVVRPTTDPASAHLPNAPPASGHDPAATPASGQPRHQPPEPPPQATAVTTTAPADSVAATTAVGTPASVAPPATAGAQAAAAAVPAGTPGFTAPGASDNGGANRLDTGRPSDRPDFEPLAADAAKATGTQHIVSAAATAAAASASDEGRSDDRTTDGSADSATSAAHPTSAQGSQHRAAAPTAEAVQTPGMPATDGARPNDDQDAAGTAANPRSAGDPAADTNVPSSGRQNDSPSVLDTRNTNGDNVFQDIVGALRAPGAQAALFAPVTQAIDAATHTQTGTHPTGSEDLTEAARNMLHTGLNHLTLEQRQLVADAAQTVQQGDGLTAAHTEAIAQLGEQLRALGENAPQHMPDLAAIEAEVLTLVANDIALETICATLGMTQRAVRGHIARAGMKLGTRGDVATMTAALSRGQLAVGAPDHSRPLSNAATHGTLTPREVEVLELATVGLSPAAIGEQLTITKDAAAAHLARAGRKLGAVGLIPTVVQAVLQRVVAGAGPQVFAPRTDSRQVADAAPAVADPAPVAESERLTKQAVAAELFDAYGVEVLGLDKACISVATALSVRNAIVDAFDEDPFIRLDVILVAPMADMTGAVIWDAGGITDTLPVVMVLNENLFGNPQEFRNAMDTAVRKGRLMAPTGDPVYDSISHEMSHLRDQAARLGNYADSVEARAFGFLYSHFMGLRAAGSLPSDTRFDDWMGQLDGYSRGRKALREDDRLFEAFDSWVSSFDSQESIEAWALRAGLSTRDGKVELEPLYQAWLQRLDVGTRERIIQAEPGSKPTLGTLPVFNPAEALAEANNAFGRSAPKDFTHPAYALQALLRGVPVAEVWRNAEHRNALAAARASNPGLTPVASSFRPSVGPDGIARKLAQAWRAMSPEDRAACADQAPAFLNPGGPQGFVLHELDRLENEHRETAASYGAPSADQTPPQTPEPTAAKKNSAAAKARERWKDKSALPAELWQQPGVTPTQRSYPAAIDLGDTSDGDKEIKQAIAAQLFTTFGIEVLGLDKPGVTVETALSIRNAVVDALGEDSAARPNAIVVTPLPGSQYASVLPVLGEPGVVVFLNETYFADTELFTASRNDDVSRGFAAAPTGDPVYDALRHELAHARDAAETLMRNPPPIDPVLYTQLVEQRRSGDLPTDARFDRRADYRNQLAPRAFGYLHEYFMGLRAQGKVPPNARFDQWLDQLDTYSKVGKEEPRNATYRSGDQPDEGEDWWGQELVFNPVEALAEADISFGRSAPVDPTHPVYALRGLLNGRTVEQALQDDGPADAATAPLYNQGSVPVGSGTVASFAPDGVLAGLTRKWRGMSAAARAEYREREPDLVIDEGDGSVTHVLDDLVRQFDQQPNEPTPRIDPVAIDLDHDAESSDVAHLQSLRDAVAARHYGAEADPVLDRVIGLIDELLAVRRGTDIPVSQERLRLLEQLAYQTAGWLARSDEAAAAGTAYDEGLREGTTAALRARQEAAEIRLGTALATFSAVWNRIHQAPEDIPAQPAEHLVTGELERLQDVAEAIFTDMADAGNEADKVDLVHREQLAEATRRYDMLRNMSEYLEQLLAFAEQPDPATMSRARRILLLDHFRAVSDLLAANEIRDDAEGRVAAATERKLRAAQAEENYGMADRGMRNIAEMLGEPQHNVAPADSGLPAAPVVWPGADGQPAYVASTETPGPAQNSSDQLGPAATTRTVAPQSNSATASSPWKRGGTSANRINPVAIDLGDDSQDPTAAGNRPRQRATSASSATPWTDTGTARDQQATESHSSAGESDSEQLRQLTSRHRDAGAPQQAAALIRHEFDIQLRQLGDAQARPETDVDRELVQQTSAEALEPAIAELTNVRFQQALTLRFVRGLNRTEAAAEVGVAIKTFEMRELRAIRAVAGVLRTRLEQPEVSLAAGVLIGAGTPKDSKPVDAESRLAELPAPDGFKRAGQLFVPEGVADSTAPQQLPAAKRDHRAHRTSAKRDHRAHRTSVPQVTDPLAPVVDVNTALDLPGRTAAPAFGFDPVRNGAYVDRHRKDGTPWFKRRRADSTPAGTDDTSLPATPATEPDVASKPGILKKTFKSDIKTRFYTSVGATLSTQGLIATTPFSILASGGSLNVAGWTTSLAFGTQFIVTSVAGPIADGKDPRQTLKLATAGAAGVGFASLAYLAADLPGTVGAIIVTNLSVTALASLIKTANLVYAKQLMESKAEEKTADNLKLLENALGSAGGRSMTGLVQSIPLLPYAATAATNTLYHLALNTLPAAEPGEGAKPSLKDGFREIWRDRFMRGFISMNLPALFVSTTMGTHMAAVATANEYSVGTLSAVSAANSIGLMIAYAVPQKLVDRVIDRPSGTREFDILSKLSWAGPAIAYATTGDPIVIGSLLGVVGFMNAFNNKIFNAHFSRVVDRKVNGSAWAALDTVGNAGGFLGGAVIGSMLSSFGNATGWIEAGLMAGSAVGGIAVGRADWKPKSFITPAAMPQPQVLPRQRPLFKALVRRDNGTPVVDLVNSTPALGDGLHGVTVAIPVAKPGLPAPQANTTAQPSVIPAAGDHGKVTSPSPVGESRNPYPAPAHTPGLDSWFRTPLDPDAAARRPRAAPPAAPDDSAITEAIDRLPYRAEAFARAESLPDRAGTAGAYLGDLMIAAGHTFDTGDIATGTTYLKSAVEILTAIEPTIGTARTARAELEQLHTALVAATDEQASRRVAETLTDLHEVVDEAVTTLRAIGCVNHVARTVWAHGYNRGVLPEYYATDLDALHRAIGARLHPVPTQQVPQTGTTITPLTAIRNALGDGEMAVVTAADTRTAHAWTIQNIGGEFFVTDNLIPDEPGIPRMRPIEDWETPYSDDTNPNLRYYAAFLGTAEDTGLPLHIDDNAADELAKVPILGKPADADPDPTPKTSPTAATDAGAANPAAPTAEPSSADGRSEDGQPQPRDEPEDGPGSPTGEVAASVPEDGAARSFEFRAGANPEEVLQQTAELIDQVTPGFPPETVAVSKELVRRMIGLTAGFDAIEHGLITVTRMHEWAAQPVLIELWDGSEQVATCFVETPYAWELGVAQLSAASSEVELMVDNALWPLGDQSAAGGAALAELANHFTTIDRGWLQVTSALDEQDSQQLLAQIGGEEGIAEVTLAVPDGGRSSEPLLQIALTIEPQQNPSVAITAARGVVRALTEGWPPGQDLAARNAAERTLRESTAQQSGDPTLHCQFTIEVDGAPGVRVLQCSIQDIFTTGSSWYENTVFEAVVEPEPMGAPVADAVLQELVIEPDSDPAEATEAAAALIEDAGQFVWSPQQDGLSVLFAEAMIGNIVNHPGAAGELVASMVRVGDREFVGLQVNVSSRNTGDIDETAVLGLLPYYADHFGVEVTGPDSFTVWATLGDDTAEGADLATTIANREAEMDDSVVTDPAPRGLSDALRSATHMSIVQLTAAARSGCTGDLALTATEVGPGQVQLVVSDRSGTPQPLLSAVAEAEDGPTTHAVFRSSGMEATWWSVEEGHEVDAAVTRITRRIRSEMLRHGWTAPDHLDAADLVVSRKLRSLWTADHIDQPWRINVAVSGEPGAKVVTVKIGSADTQTEETPAVIELFQRTAQSDPNSSAIRRLFGGNGWFDELFFSAGTDSITNASDIFEGTDSHSHVERFVTADAGADRTAVNTEINRLVDTAVKAVPAVRARARRLLKALVDQLLLNPGREGVVAVTVAMGPAGLECRVTLADRHSRAPQVISRARDLISPELADRAGIEPLGRFGTITWAGFDLPDAAVTTGGPGTSAAPTKPARNSVPVDPGEVLGNIAAILGEIDPAPTAPPAAAPVRRPPEAITGDIDELLSEFPAPPPAPDTPEPVQPPGDTTRDISAQAESAPIPWRNRQTPAAGSPTELPPAAGESQQPDVPLETEAPSAAARSWIDTDQSPTPWGARAAERLAAAAPQQSVDAPEANPQPLPPPQTRTESVPGTRTDDQG
ncbi:LuxR C-terminal-related transcriptional regulator [Nocardia sp. KC 131]|uniref:LuxR C-terminal-related transcriptional regulator n=1 Tax=Nocardia arseniciresistens TaxID=3392119 RepID=UPI00398F7562